MIAWSAGGGANRAIKPKIRQIEVGDEGIDHAHQALGRYIVINARRLESSLPDLRLR